MVLAEGRVLVCASRAASILPPLREGIQGQGIQAVLLLLRFLGHFRGVSHAFPFTGRRAWIPSSYPQVNRFHGVILSALLRLQPGARAFPRGKTNGVTRTGPRPYPPSRRPTPASNTRERIRIFIFISLAGV